jgi:hypothetical protein
MHLRCPSLLVAFEKRIENCAADAGYATLASLRAVRHTGILCLLGLNFDRNEKVSYVAVVFVADVASDITIRRVTHLALHKDAPLHRAVQRFGRIAGTPILAGLHHRYVRI